LNNSFSGPFGLSFDRNGNLYIADLRGAKAYQLALGSFGFGAENIGTATASAALSFQIAVGTTIGKINVLTLGASGLDFTGTAGSTCTAGAYTTTTTCTLHVQFKPIAAGARNGAVVFLDPGNNVLTNLPIYGIGLGPQIAWQPGSQSLITGGVDNRDALAVDGSGNVFTFTSQASTIPLVEFPAGGGPAITLGGDFKLPQGIAIDGSGNVYVADADNGQVDGLFAANGYTTAKSLGSGFVYPTAVAVDANGNIFVLDGSPTALKEIPASSGGATVLTLATVPGLEEGDGTLALDSNGNIFVSYANPSTLNPPDNTQGYLEEIFRAGGYQTSKLLSSGFILPRGLAVDASDNVYVADEGFNTIQELVASSGYTLNLPLGSGFKQVEGVSLDARGNIYALDYTHIEKIDLADPPSLVFPTSTLSSCGTSVMSRWCLRRRRLGAIRATRPTSLRTWAIPPSARRAFH
jgi:sugar lactone lactonase YvrE